MKDYYREYEPPIPRKKLSDKELTRRYYEGELDEVTAQLYSDKVAADATKAVEELGSVLNKIKNRDEGARGGKRGANTRQESSAVMRGVIRARFDELQRHYSRHKKNQLIDDYLIPWLKNSETQLREAHGVDKVIYSKSQIYTFLK